MFSFNIMEVVEVDMYRRDCDPKSDNGRKEKRYVFVLLLQIR